MIPLFAVSVFLRALLFGSTAIALENLALRPRPLRPLAVRPVGAD